MKGCHFSENEEVAHIDCLTVKMRVVKLYWRYTDQSTGESKPDPKEGFKKERKKWFDGLECQWWEQGSLKSKRFHSQMLVPWAIAEQGEEEVKKWIKEIL